MWWRIVPMIGVLSLSSVSKADEPCRYTDLLNELWLKQFCLVNPALRSCEALMGMLYPNTPQGRVAAAQLGVAVSSLHTHVAVNQAMNAFTDRALDQAATSTPWDVFEQNFNHGAFKYKNIPRT